MCRSSGRKPKQVTPLRVETEFKQDDTPLDGTNPNSKAAGWWRPLHPLFVLAMLPFCPTWFFLNRGYTQWFHWGFIFYWITGQRDTFRRYLFLQGCSVTAGWYLSVVHEYFVYGRFCHLLYNNMPLAMRVPMMVNGNLASGGIITDTWPALASLVMAHAIDILAHPYLTYAFWRMHKSRGGTLKTLITWDVVVASYIHSRIYSMSHIYYNTGVLDGSMFYYGYDVYKIDNLESYTAAYVGEALCYAGIIAYKLYMDAGGRYLTIRFGGKKGRRRNRLSPKLLKKLCIHDRQKPRLVQSESSFSATSNAAEQ